MSVFDVARYILEKTGEITTMKLQKLVYYSQAWSLVWDEAPLFNEKITAWIDGPVVPELYQAHKGLFHVQASDISGDSTKLSSDQKETIDAVLGHYAKMTAAQLSRLTHEELPWIEARSGLEPTDNSASPEIPLASIASFYTALYNQLESNG